MLPRFSAARALVTFVVLGLAAGVAAGSPALIEAYHREDPAKVVQLAQPLAAKGDADGQFILGLFQTIGAGADIDQVSARRWLERAADQGHAGAKLALAWRWRTGFGQPRVDEAEAGRLVTSVATINDSAYAPWLVRSGDQFEPDFNAAFLWLVQAATQGSPAAMRNLATCYLAPQWTNPDAAEHLRWLQQSADAGDPEALTTLSLYHDSGWYVERDIPVAFDMLHRAAEAGSARAQALLAWRYEGGGPVLADPPAALRWYGKAEKQDYLPAIIRLVELRSGNGYYRDLGEALRVAKHGRALEDATCTRYLADLFYRGDGVRRDPKQAVKLYTEAAARGDGLAMTLLGQLARDGRQGPADLAGARAWFERAADVGETQAMCELGDLAERGLGVPADSARAFRWYEKAARLGNATAQQRLAAALLSGRGADRDPVEAVNWMRVASNQDSGRLFAPRLQAWPLGSDPAEIVAALLTLATEETDPWVEFNLLHAIQERPERRSALEALVIAQLSRSDLLQVPGGLPEACLAVLEANPAYADRAEQLAHQLLQADRAQSAWTLGLHSLAGRYMVRDPARTEQYAKTLSTRLPWRGTVLAALAGAESATADKEKDRAANTLLNFAQAGEPESNLALARLVLARQANSLQRSRFLLYQARTIQYARLTGQTELADKLRAYVRAAASGPAEDLMVQRLIAALKARTPGSDAPPESLFRFGPPFPAELRDVMPHGEVRVEFVVDVDGRVGAIEIVESSHPLFSAAATETIEQWRFAPGWKQGRPVAIRVKQTLEFDYSAPLPHASK